ncbi:DUF4244 domain-containing protein [Corynebacterium propinquum]|nr:MAG: DUF4244 domain-containing protein [Corynebacterium propinquum]QQU91437.1 DUF4244 domain-containing protein [Corynebacterium propinquum]
MTTPFPSSQPDQPANLLLTKSGTHNPQANQSRQRQAKRGAQSKKPGLQLLADDSGMSTIEYAMGSLAAAALAAALYLVVSSGGVTDAIESIITDALSDTPS